MGLLSIFQRGNRAATSGPDAGDPVQAARARARHRLIGAAVLVIAGVIGFPLVFETQPRPIPVDIPIEIPRRDGAPPLAMPGPKPAAKPTAAAPTPAASAVVAAPRDDTLTESKAEAGREVPAASAPTAAATALPATSSRPASAPNVDVTKKPSETRAAVVTADAARAKALLEGKESKAAPKTEDPKDGGRYVVQIGAFADAAAAREMRSKAEKLGLKTYMQVVETGSGSRTRVRIGPFASREEADKAMARAKAAGLNAVVLTL